MLPKGFGLLSTLKEKVKENSNSNSNKVCPFPTQPSPGDTYTVVATTSCLFGTCPCFSAGRVHTQSLVSELNNPPILAVYTVFPGVQVGPKRNRPGEQANKREPAQRLPSHSATQCVSLPSWPINPSTDTPSFHMQLDLAWPRNVHLSQFPTSHQLATCSVFLGVRPQQEESNQIEVARLHLDTFPPWHLSVPHPPESAGEAARHDKAAWRR
jgi:hypothetical protein